MNTKKYFPLNMVILFSFFLTLSCAKPNYQDSINSDLQTPTSENKPQDPHSLQPTCELVLKSVGTCLYFQWIKKPSSTEYGHFQLILKKINTKEDLTPEEWELIFPQLAVILWMPSMGHGSIPVKLSKKSDGIIDVENVFFIMPGDWEIRIQLKNKMEIYDQTSLYLFI